MNDIVNHTIKYKTKFISLNFGALSNVFTKNSYQTKSNVKDHLVLIVIIWKDNIHIG